MPFFRGTRYVLLGGLKYRYFLRDDFLTDLGIGAINGTMAEPGPGTRSLADVDGVVTISGDWIEFGAQTNVPSYIEEELIYKDIPITRQVGQVVMCRWKCTTSASHYPLVLVNSLTPVWLGQANIIHGFRRSGATTLSSVDDEAVGVNLMEFVADGTEYDLAIYLLAVGAYYFSKESTSDTWLFLRFSEVGNAATMYVASSGLTAVYGLSNIRAPKALYTGDLVALV